MTSLEAYKRAKKYDVFNVGDYVEDKYHNIGYITYICHCDKCEERGFYEPTVRITYPDTDYPSFEYITDTSLENSFSAFKRIGKYDRDKLDELTREFKEVRNGKE